MLLLLLFSSRCANGLVVFVHRLYAFQYVNVQMIMLSMGFKRCVDISQAMGIQTFNEGEYIVTEGERGLTFYIIVSGPDRAQAGTRRCGKPH